MITHRGIWAIAHMLSCSVSKHSCIPSIVSNKRVALPLTKARIGLERQRQTCAVRAKRTEYSIEQIRQSLQRLKIAKIVRLRNLHNFRTIGSVFFRHTFAIQVVNHWPTPIANSLGSGTRHAACSRARVPRNHPSSQEDPSSVHDIWAIAHMLVSQVAALKCFHCVTKVGYS